MVSTSESTNPSLFFQEDMGLQISATDISSRGNSSKKVFARWQLRKNVYHAKKVLSAQFCCDVEVRLRSALVVESSTLG